MRFSEIHLPDHNGVDPKKVEWSEVVEIGSKDEGISNIFTLENIEEKMKNEMLDRDSVLKVIRDVLHSRLHGRPYDHEKCKRLSAKLVFEIRERLRRQCFEDQDDYKILVYVYIGQIWDEGIESATQCSWSPQSDLVVCGSYKTDSLIAVVTVFATYCI